MSQGQVREERDEGLSVLTLSNPSRRNGMDSSLLDQLAESVRRVVTDRQVRAVLITGDPAGEAFSAGGDLAELTGDDPPAVADRWTHVTVEVAGRIFHAEKPVIAAVDGPAVGAGFALALACDVVLASPRARFGPVFARRGILADHAALWFLPRAVGLLRAKELVFSGRIVDADEAVQIGLATDLVEGDFVSAVRAYAAELAAGPTRALGYSKVILNKGLETDMFTVQTFERLVQPSLFASDDFREAFAAFREGRDPDFRGS